MWTTFIVVHDQPRPECAQLLRAANYDVFELNDRTVLARTDDETALTEAVAVAANIKGPNRIEDLRRVDFELDIGRAGYHKNSLWEWLRRRSD